MPRLEVGRHSQQGAQRGDEKSCLDYNGGYITVYFVQLIRQHVSKRGILLNMNYTINNSNLKKLIESLKQGVNKREKIIFLDHGLKAENINYL